MIDRVNFQGYNGIATTLPMFGVTLESNHPIGKGGEVSG
jgi:hypothetical protein